MGFIRCLIAAMVAAEFAGVVMAAPTITPIGIINQDPSVASRALAINADGTVVVGTNEISPGVNYAIRWSVSGGLQNLSCGSNSGLYAVSASGAAAVGAVNNGSIFLSGRWDSPGACVIQSSQPITSSGARTVGMNPTGTIVVGSTDQFSTFGPYSVPYKWTQSGGVAYLPFPSGHNFGFANAVSSNSQVIVGGTGSIGIFTVPQAAYWDSAGAHNMGFMPAGIASTATACSSDGAVIVGFGDNGGAAFSPGPYRAFRWNGGVYQPLGLLAGAPSNGNSFARDVSEDGSVIVGESSTATSQSAFIWRQDFGMKVLASLLAELGVNLTGWTNLSECYGISADATALCGTGVYNGVSQGFVVRGLPKLCGPLITGHSLDNSFCSGPSNVNYLIVNGYFPVGSTFQWNQQFGDFPFHFVLPVTDGTYYSGATTFLLFIYQGQPALSGDYFCEISGGCASVTTGIININFLSAPVVTIQPPLDLAPCGKGPVTLTIAATSDAGPLAYQWQAEVPFMSNNFISLIPTINWGVATASGTSTPSLTLTDFYLTGATTYRCLVSNSCGYVYTQSTLIVPCFGDFNCDGSVDFFDYLDFVDSYSATGPDADFNKDGSVDFFDYLDFVDSYSAGC